MSSESLHSDRDVDPPNYLWQEVSSRPPSTSSLSSIPRADVNVIDFPDPTRYQVFKMVLGASFRAPVSSQLTSGIRVLSVNAGDLEWAKDMAETYPNSEFESVTILQSATHQDNLPNNIKHYLWNVREKFFYTDSVFDFVYVGALLFHLRAEEWPDVLCELFRVLKPGGFIELLESSIWCGNMGPTGEIMATTMSYSFQARGIHTKIGRELPILLKNAGFVNIVKFHVSAPIGWGPASGIAYGRFMRSERTAMIPFLMKSLGWTRERLTEEFVKADQESVEFKTYNNIHKAYAQKP